MKEWIQKHKKVCIGIAVVLCMAICVTIAIMPMLKGESGSEEDRSTQWEAVVSDDVTAGAIEDIQDDVTGDAVDEVTMEAVTSEALEIVEDSPLDVVESVPPAPTTPPAATATETPTPKPGSDISNMAQNVAFPYEIHVNKQMNCITVYAMDNNGAYSIPLKAMVCSTGAATPTGVYKTPAKYIWKLLKGNVWGQYSTRISGSILFHSVPYSTNSKSALISKYYNKLGTTASAGCVRLTTADAKWIYDNCPLGTTVVIYNDGNPGPLGKPKAMKVPVSNKWDPTDPDPKNPWKGKIARIEGVHNITAEKGQKPDLKAGVKAYNGSGVDVTSYLTVSSNVDWKKAGSYSVHYTIVDQSGNETTADAMVTITDTQCPVIQGVQGVISGKRASEITREFLLEGVTVTDNGLSFDLSKVEVQIPELKDGANTIRYIARDEVGNTTTVTTTVHCDRKAPVVSKKAGVPSMLRLDEVLDQNTLVNRINIQDASATTVEHQLSVEEWGFRIDYTVSDQYGNVTTFTDHVPYMEYTINGEQVIAVDNLSDKNQLLEGLTLKDSFGTVKELPVSTQIDLVQTGGTYYRAVYTYTYYSPVGSRQATFERLIMTE